MCIFIHTKIFSNTELLFTKTFWDRIGIGLSGVCAIHCLFIPVLIALFPLWPLAYTIHEWAHPVFFVLIVPTVVLAIRKSKADRSVCILLLTGVFMLALAWLMHYWIGHTAETITTLIGSATLVIGHWQNYRQHSARSCSTNKM